MNFVFFILRWLLNCFIAATRLNANFFNHYTDTTEEPYSTEGVSTSESYANHFGTISIVLFITFSVVITSCCSLCIFILLLRRNHRKRKVNPEKICLEMPILTVNQSPSSILTEKNDLAGSGRTERSELNHRNRTIGIATQIALEWNEVDV